MIENNTTYNEETIHESWQVLKARTKRYPKIYTAFVIVAILIQFLLFGPAVGAITFVVGVITSTIFFRSANRKVANAEKKSIDRIKEKYEKGYYNCNMKFDDEKIIVSSEDSENSKEIPHEDYRKMKETEHLLILFYFHRGYVMVDKRGFVQGSEKELKALMKKHSK